MFRYIQKRYKRVSKDWNYFLSGCWAGLVTIVIRTPIELVKIRLQAERSKFDSFVDVTRKVVNKNGFLGLYKGFCVTLNRDLITSGLYVYVYFRLKDYYMENNLTNHFNLFCAGGLAGMLSNIVCFPFDPMKTIIQNTNAKMTQIEAFKWITFTQGYKGLFNGIVPVVIRSFYVHGIVFFVNDLCHYLINNYSV
jgi:hypothetical protein